MPYESLHLLTLAAQRPDTRYDPLGLHIGRSSNRLINHRKQVARSCPLDKHPPYLRHVLNRMTDDRVLFTAIEMLCRNGDTAPGYSDLRLIHLTYHEKWALARSLSQSLRQGLYRPGRVKSKKVEKAGKPGKFRTIAIQTPEDRIVAKSAALILEPIAERVFSSLSFGFRPGCGPLMALATARTLIETYERIVWVSVDVADAFEEVPLSQILAACRALVPNEMVIAHLEMLSRSGRRGVRQGSPLSPLLWNIFADHFIDRPWSRRFPGIPLLRYADDLALACRSPQEAHAAQRSLAQLVRSAGTPLKDAANSVFDLSAGESMEWLGYRLAVAGSRLSLTITDKAWGSLDGSLAAVHELPASPIRAVAMIQGWLNYVAPCLASEDLDLVLGRVSELASQHAFDEIESIEQMRPRAKEMAAPWAAMRQVAAERLAAHFHLTRFNP